MNKKSLFSWTRVICLVVALIAVMAYAMTVDTLSQMQTTLMVGGQDMAIQAQPFVKTAMALNMVQTDQGLAALTSHRGQFEQFAPFAPAAAEVPKPYNFILIGISIKGKGTLAGQDIKNIYLLKTVMVENHGGIGGIAPQFFTANPKILKI